MRASLPWAAGLFEGEGSIQRQSVTRWQLTLSSTDVDVLLAFAKVVGCGKAYGPYDQKNRRVDGGPCKPYWRWVCSDKQGILTVAKRLMPYLGERRAGRMLECVTEVQRVKATRSAHTRRDRSPKLIWVGEEWDWAPDFLAAYEADRSIVRAARSVGVSSTAIFERRDVDPVFDAAVAALVPEHLRQREAA